MKTRILFLFCLAFVVGHAQYFDMDKDAPSFTLEETKQLQSLPGAPHVIYINVEAYYVWKNSPENIAQVVRVWRQVAEDYRPFNVNVTTRREDLKNIPTSNVLYMNINIHYAGGSCPLGMYGKGESIGGQNCHSSLQFYSFTHETGHGMGIHHHTTFDNLIGDGFKYVNTHVSVNHNGAYYSHWMKGEVENGPSPVDDIQLLSSKLGWRPQDHGSSFGAATPIIIDDEVVHKTKNNGTICKDGEVDFFKFTTGGGEIDLNINPLKYYNNLHAKASLVDEEGVVVIEGLPIFHFDIYDYPYVPDDLKGRLLTQVKHAVKIKGDLAAGTYYLKVTNTGFVDSYGDGYTSYSSLGYYELDGKIESLPLNSIDLSKDNLVTIFPNPTSEFVRISTDKTYNSIKIFDTKGSLVLTFDAQNEICISELSHGKYILQLLNESEIISSKMLVVK